MENITEITLPCPLRSTAAHRQVTNPDTMDWKQKKELFPFTNKFVNKKRKRKSSFNYQWNIQYWFILLLMICKCLPHIFKCIIDGTKCELISLVIVGNSQKPGTSWELKIPLHEGRREPVLCYHTHTHERSVWCVKKFINSFVALNKCINKAINQIHYNVNIQLVI